MTTEDIAWQALEARLEKPVTAKHLAQVLEVHSVTILKWAREGRIPCRRISPRKIVFLPSQIAQWLAEREGYTESVGRAA